MPLLGEMLCAAAPTLWLAALCVYALRRAAAALSGPQLRAAALTGLRFSVLPGLGAVLGMAVLGGYAGLPLAWVRLASAGSLQYELSAYYFVVGDYTTVPPGLLGTVALVQTVGSLARPLLCLVLLPWYCRRRKTRAGGGRYRLFLAAAIAALPVSALALGLPQGGAFWGAIGYTVLLSWPGALAEFFLLTPVLGPETSCLALAAGSLSTVRLPCVLAARHRAGEHAPGAAEAGLAAAAASVLGNLAVTGVGALALWPVVPHLGGWLRRMDPVVKILVPAMYLLPALQVAWRFVRKWLAKRAGKHIGLADLGQAAQRAIETTVLDPREGRVVANAFSAHAAHRHTK